MNRHFERTGGRPTFEEAECRPGVWCCAVSADGLTAAGTASSKKGAKKEAARAFMAMLASGGPSEE